MNKIDENSNFNLQDYVQIEEYVNGNDVYDITKSNYNMDDTIIIHFDMPELGKCFNIFFV